MEREVYYRATKSLSIIVFIILITVMAAATFIGQNRGQMYASEHVYSTWWFTALWAVAALSGGVYALHKMGRRAVVWILHASFVLILIGALTTELTARHGTINLAQGDQMTMFTLNDRDNTLVDMPVMLTLDSFKVKYYSGSRMPSDYVSHVTVTDKSDGHSMRADISMNNILSCRNYRFYQMSFNPEDGSSTLAVNYDPYGIPVSYVGYCLLFCASLWMLFSRRCGFRLLLSSMGSRQRQMLIGSMMAVAVVAVVSVMLMVGSKTHLMPVLRSRLLYVHVSALMIAYLFMAAIFVMAVVALVRRAMHHAIHDITTCSRILLYPSVAMMGIGIFLGAIWANISWGNYWSWDPKETWALIAFLVYAAGLHRGSLKPMRGDVFYNAYMIFTFLILLMTYLGVNFYLSGMHSYA